MLDLFWMKCKLLKIVTIVNKVHVVAYMETLSHKKKILKKVIGPEFEDLLMDHSFIMIPTQKGYFMSVIDKLETC